MDIPLYRRTIQELIVFSVDYPGIDFAHDIPGDIWLLPLHVYVAIDVSMDDTTGRLCDA